MAINEDVMTVQKLMRKPVKINPSDDSKTLRNTPNVRTTRLTHLFPGVWLNCKRAVNIGESDLTISFIETLHAFNAMFSMQKSTAHKIENPNKIYPIDFGIDGLLNIVR
jgi:hypothetical protein